MADTTRKYSRGTEVTIVTGHDLDAPPAEDDEQYELLQELYLKPAEVARTKERLRYPAEFEEMIADQIKQVSPQDLPHAVGQIVISCGCQGLQILPSIPIYQNGHLYLRCLGCMRVGDVFELVSATPQRRT